MSAQLKNFFDQTGPLWLKGALVNKVATVMSSTATQHGGAEMTIITTQVLLQHQGMIIVPLSYAYPGQSGNDVVRGGAPYGMTTTSRFRRLAPAFRAGAGRRQVPGQAPRRDHHQAARVS